MCTIQRKFYPASPLPIYQVTYLRLYFRHRYGWSSDSRLTGLDSGRLVSGTAMFRCPDRYHLALTLLFDLIYGESEAYRYQYRKIC